MPFLARFPATWCWFTVWSDSASLMGNNQA
jgi:hypothetical protein